MGAGGVLDALCVGNATRDVFIELPRQRVQRALCLPAGAKLEARAITARTGGGATNTAVAFARMGFSTGVLAAVGDDAFACAIRERLRREGVSLRHLVVSKRYRTAYSAILTGFGGERVILAYGGATRHLLEGHLDWAALRARLVYVSSLHARPRLLQRLFRHCAGQGAFVAFNPGSAELALGLEGLAPCLERARVVLLNRRELAQLVPGRRRAAMRAVQRFTPVVVCTEGRKGAWAFDGRQWAFQPAYRVRVRDTTGAGDAFGSAFVAARFLGRPLQACLRWGARNAASVVRFLGPKERLLSRAALERGGAGARAPARAWRNRVSGARGRPR